MEKNPHGLITLLKKIEGAGFEDGHQKSANIIITWLPAHLFLMGWW